MGDNSISYILTETSKKLPKSYKGVPDNRKSLESNYEKLNEKSISGVKFPTIHNKYPVDNVTKTTDLRQLFN